MLDISAARRSLHHTGFAFVKRFMPGVGTLELARGIGKVLDLSLVAPSYSVAALQELKPVPRDDLRLNHYHGNFGLGEYPPHSDFAHWNRPPRYLLLRAKRGHPQVETHVFSAETLSQVLPAHLLNAAVFAARKSEARLTPLAMKVSRSLDFSLRWDPIFIRALNEAANECTSLLTAQRLHESRICVALGEPDDTLILDNWRTLHGRSAVPSDAKSRCLERVYLEEIYE